MAENFYIGQGTMIKVIYKNVSDHSLKISDNLQKVSLLVFSVVDSHGKKVPCRNDAKFQALPQEEHLVEVGKGQVFEGTVNIDQEFFFSDSDTYTVSAVYQGLTDPGPRSNEVKVKLALP